MGITIKEMAKRNYARGLWTDEMLDSLMQKGKLTIEEVQEIKMVNSAGGGGTKPLIKFYLQNGTAVALYG